MQPVLPAAPAVDVSQTSGSVQRAVSRMSKSLQALWKTILAHPAVAVVPLLAFSIITVAGVLTIYFVARNQEQDERNAATNTATQVAMSLQQQFMSLVQPATAMSAFLSSGLGLNYTFAREIFNKVAPKLLAQVPAPSTNTCPNCPSLQLVPQGRTTDIYPWNQITHDILYGFDYLANERTREASLSLLRHPSKVALVGPQQLRSTGPEELSFMSLAAIMPVFISGVEEDSDFGSPWPVSPLCPPDLCWQPATKTKNWGAVDVSLPLEAMLHDNGPLMRLRPDGFHFMLRQPAANALVPPTPGYGDFVLLERSDGDVKDPVVVPVDLNTNIIYQAAPWVLSVSPEGGWAPSWEVPLYVVVVVISLVIALLLMALMISRVEHQDLLFSLVPENVVKQLKDSGAISQTTSKAKAAVPPGSTPAEVLLALLSDCLLGKLPEPGVVVQLRAVLLSLQDIYRPADVSQELREALDDDVAENLANLLTNDSPWARERGTYQPQGSDASGRPSDSPSDAIFNDLEPGLAMLVAGQARMSCAPEQLLGIPSLIGITQDLPRGVSPGVAMASGDLSETANSEGPGSFAAAYRGASFTALSPATLTTKGLTGVDNVRTQSGPSSAGLRFQAAPRDRLARQVPDELLSILGHGYSSWTFDAFALDRASQGHPLSTLGFYLMEKTDLMQHFKLPPATVARFFQALEASYLDNPYHSRTHAADVLQTLHVILSQGGFLHSYVDPVRHLACILAASAHDVEHVGLTNDFICSTEDALALRYNDRSPMENHHLATLFSLLKLPNHDFTKHLGRDTRDLMRKVAIEMVMSTDMKSHMTLVSQFKSVHANQASRQGGGDQPKLSVSGADCGEPLAAAAGPVFIDETERLLSLQVAMKVADLGDLAEKLEVHKVWVSSLEDEFFQQGDKEREAGMSITPLFDRHKPGVTKSQVGFYDFVVMPLFNSFGGVFKNVQPLVEGAADNYRFWKNIGLGEQGVRLSRDVAGKA